MSGICSAFPEALVAVGVTAFRIEDRWEAQHGETREGCGCEHAGVVVAGGDGPAGGVPKRLLKLSVDVGRQDEQRGEVETNATGDRTRADRGRQTTSGVRAEGPNSHFCFLVRKPGARGDETIRYDYLWVASMFIY
jgi:hypothetical protein